MFVGSFDSEEGAVRAWERVAIGLRKKKKTGLNFPAPQDHPAEAEKLPGLSTVTEIEEFLSPRGCSERAGPEVRRPGTTPPAGGERARGDLPRLDLPFVRPPPAPTAPPAPPARAPCGDALHHRTLYHRWCSGG